VSSNGVDGPSPTFAVAYMYAVNKAAHAVLGRSGVALSRVASDSLWSFLVSRGLVPSEPTFDDLRRLFVEHLRLASDVRVVEEGEEVVVVLEGLTIGEFLEAAAREGFEPTVCPLAMLLVKACERMKGGRLVVRRFEVAGPRTVRVRCARV